MKSRENLLLTEINHLKVDLESARRDAAVKLEKVQIFNRFERISDPILGRRRRYGGKKSTIDEIGKFTTRSRIQPVVDRREE